MKMTEKQRRFADFYIELSNGTEAAIKAGYSKKTARAIAAENLTKPYISDYIEKRLEELASERIANQQEIMEYLTSVVRGDARGTALVGAGMGAQDVKQVSPTVSERTAAAISLGKRYAMWTDKQEVSGTVNHNLDMSGLSLEELKNLANLDQEKEGSDS